MTVVTSDLFVRAATAWGCVAGVAIFCRSAHMVGLLKLAVFSAALLATWVVADTVLAVGMWLSPAWSHGVTVRPETAACVTAFSTLGMLAFLATAWRMENAMRVPSTGWTWALACALVVAVGAWRLRAGPASLDTSLSYARIAPYTMLVSYAVLAASMVSLAIPCLQLRRRLIGAPAVVPALGRAPLVRALQLHAASLEGKLALAIGLTMLGCCSVIPAVAFVVSGSAWGRVFVVGDVVLDLVALLAMARFVREATGPRWLIAGLLLRVPLLIDAGHQGWTIAALFALPAAVVGIVGHARIARWLSGRVEPYCLRKTRDAYRDATRFLIAALSILAVAGLFTGSKRFFVVISAPTAIVGLQLLRRHVEAALVALKEAGDAAEPLAKSG